MIRTRLLRRLLLAEATDDSRPPHLSAASGLVQLGDWLYVVADDELHLGLFSASRDEPGALIRCFEGTLPSKPKKRKAEKPDLETLTTLPPFTGFPHGALLALGSGSRPTREHGALLGIDSAGRVEASPRPFSLSELYDDLRQTVGDLNIEGAALWRGRFCFLQRGNKSSSNAIVECELAPFIADLAASRAPRLQHAPLIRRYDLGHINGIPLCFTDATVLPNDALLFSAAAEDTDNSIDDGACRGSAIGVIDQTGAVTFVEAIADTCKVEGVSAAPLDGAIRLLLVTDADDAHAPASLLEAEVRLR